MCDVIDWSEYDVKLWASVMCVMCHTPFFELTHGIRCSLKSTISLHIVL